MIVVNIEDSQKAIQAVKQLGLANFEEIEAELLLLSDCSPRLQGPNSKAVLTAALRHVVNLGLLKTSVGPNGMKCWSTSGYQLPNHMKQESVIDPA
jgi:hypothetical protein